MTALHSTNHQSAVDSGWIPFEFLGPDVPIVSFPAIANGNASISLTLDTGNASGLHASETLARRLGLTFSEPVPVPEEKYSVGTDHKPTAFFSSLNSLSIGSWHQGEVEVTISNYVDYLAESVSPKWEANVGQGVFGQLCVTVDYPAQRLRFSEAPTVEVAASRLRLGEYPWAIVRARVNGCSPRNFILDTGAGGTLIDSDLAAEIGLELGEEAQMQGATGIETARLAHGVSVQVGRRRVKNLSVVVNDLLKSLSVGAGMPLSGIVGYDFFKDSILVIDYKRKRIGFK
jgi:predicted aspartyl protease